MIAVFIASSLSPRIETVLLRSQRMVNEPRDAGLLGTMRAAKHCVVALHTMAQDTAAAVVTLRCQRVDGAFKGIEIITATFHCYLKRLFIYITAGIAGCHATLQYHQEDPDPNTKSDENSIRKST
jgi:hypothetical protein